MGIARNAVADIMKRINDVKRSGTSENPVSASAARRTIFLNGYLLSLACLIPRV